MDEDRIRRMVRRVVYRTLGIESQTKPPGKRILITELDVRDLPFRSEYPVPPNALVTPLARQVAMDRQIKFTGSELKSKAPVSESINPTGGSPSWVAIGADHGGFALKETLKEYLQHLGYQVHDCGATSTDSVDYPDYAYAVASMVAEGQAWRGIIIDGAGIGSCMVANKVPGVLAAMCYDQATAVNSREHNDANVLTLGAGLIGVGLAKQIVTVWLETKAAGGRHARRVEKIKAIERRFHKAAS
jgi:ribose 5-phosphate isomerase B